MNSGDLQRRSVATRANVSRGGGIATHGYARANSTEKQCCAKAKCGAEQTREVAVKFRSACAVTQRQGTAALGPTANGGAKALLRTEAC